MLCIQLAGYMMLVNPIVSLWGAVNKGTSETYKFFTKYSREGNTLTDKRAKDYFNILLLKIQRYHDKNFEKSHLECGCCEIGRRHRKLDLIFITKSNDYHQ